MQATKGSATAGAREMPEWALPAGIERTALTETRPISAIACLLLLELALPAHAQVELPTAPLQPRIVNGLPTHDYPSTAALMEGTSSIQFCSAVLVGCETVLTAAHCVCLEDGSQCQTGGSALLDPANLKVFLPHAGFFSVADISVPPDFEFGVREDVAILTLTEPVTGITPSRLNTIARLAEGSRAEIVGFGTATEAPFDNGIKRAGEIETTSCDIVDGGQYICWDFIDPLGAPGTDANTCMGDSGGPLFDDFGSGNVVAGLGSGGVRTDCQTDDSPFNLDIFANRNWILATGGADLEVGECGDLPPVGGPGAITIDHSGDLDSVADTVDHTFEVPAGTHSLRVALNGEEGLFFNDFDLELSPGAPPPTGPAACTSTLSGTFEFCEIAEPAAGTWNARVLGLSGEGEYQLTIALLREVDLGPCVPDGTTLCIDDELGDGRFEVTISWDTSQAGGVAGLGQVIELAPVGIDFGGVFWFFDARNPEILFKVLNACSVNGHYWVFWSAGTNVRLVITVLDRKTGHQRVYFNPDRNPAAPVTDTAAFSCPQ